MPTLWSQTDTAGVVGRSSGLIQGCSNAGAVGYPHVGYNVGGVAGRQSGYVAGCSNTGAIYGRKDVGGIVGQAEPNLILNADADAIEALRRELDALNSTINRALDHTDRSGTAISARLTGMGACADSARDSAKALLDSAGSFVDNNIAAINSLSASVDGLLTDLDPAFGDLSAGAEVFSDLADDLEAALKDLARAADAGEDLMENAQEAVGALRAAGGGLKRAAAALRQAAGRLKKAVVIQDEAELAQALDQLGAASGEAGAALLAWNEAMQGGLPAEAQAALVQAAEALRNMGTALGKAGDALEVLRANVAVDWGQLRAVLGDVADAMAALEGAGGSLDAAFCRLGAALSTGTVLSGRLESGLEKLAMAARSGARLGDRLRGAFTGVRDAVRRFTDRGPVEFSGLGEAYEAAGNDLYASFATLSDELTALNGEIGDAGDVLNADLRAISRQFNRVFHLLLDTVADIREGVETPDLSRYIEDTSDEDIAATRLGKIEACRNSGRVEGDRSVGGVVGSMAIEHSLDPEDDALPQPPSARPTRARPSSRPASTRGR